MNEKIYVGYEDQQGKVHFIELKNFKKFYNVYSESHLKLCYKALKDNKLV